MVDVEVSRSRKKCQVPECCEPVRGKGFCTHHYDRWRRGGDPFDGKQKRRPPGSLSSGCSVDGCESRALALDLCNKHYTKLRKFGSVSGGYEQDGRSKQWHVRKGGYVIKFDRGNPNANESTGIVFQHREVMASILGRPLLPMESVHHKNGNRADNRPENLELWIRGQPAGQRVQDQVKWARELLQRYSGVAIE